MKLSSKILVAALWLAGAFGVTAQAAENVAHPMSTLKVEVQNKSVGYGYTYTCENPNYGWCYANPAPVGATCFCYTSAYSGFYGTINAYY